MDGWLERGLEVSAGCRIRNLYASGDKWQLYSTNNSSYVLAATPEMINTWTTKYELPQGLFFSIDSSDFLIYVEDEQYCLASLKYGPYSVDPEAVETLFLAYNRLMKHHPGTSCEEALFIERYSLILPTCNTSNTPNDVILGTWVSHGVGISLKDENISQFTPWLVGYKLPSINLEETTSFSEKEDSNVGASNKTITVPNERFILKGRPELESFFNDQILDVLRNPEVYKAMGISFPGATILHGPSGTGKTYAVENFASFIGWPVFEINSKTIGSPYIHDTSKKISAVFDDAIKNSPSVLIIDEMEAFLSKRVGAEQGMYHNEEVAEFLRRIPEAISKYVLIFAMTNMLDLVDSAISRKGRFDYVLEVKPATKQDIVDVLTDKLKKLPVDSDVNISEIATKLEGRPLSDVAFIVKEAGRIAAKQRLTSLNSDCLNQALTLLPEVKKTNRIGFKANN